MYMEAINVEKQGLLLGNVKKNLKVKGTYMYVYIYMHIYKSTIKLSTLQSVMFN